MKNVAMVIQMVLNRAGYSAIVNVTTQCQQKYSV